MSDYLTFLQQHTLLTSIFIGAFLCLIVIEFIKIKKGHKSLNPAQTTSMINHQNAIIVDIRAAEDYSKGHIIDAISIPLSDIDKKMKRIEKNKLNPIIIVCSTTQDGTKAIHLLENNGFKQVYILGGGIGTWRQAELPLVTEKA